MQEIIDIFPTGHFLTEQLQALCNQRAEVFRYTQDSLFLMSPYIEMVHRELMDRFHIGSLCLQLNAEIIAFSSTHCLLPNLCCGEIINNLGKRVIEKLIEHGVAGPTICDKTIYSQAPCSFLLENQNTLQNNDEIICHIEQIQNRLSQNIQKIEATQVESQRTIHGMKLYQPLPTQLFHCRIHNPPAYLLSPNMFSHTYLYCDTHQKK